ncbi:MAG TPA: thioredoxin [Candidatus Pullichristensenella avicola]|nr:thioredoxin [Candidatus Pullichristensenella avicola]
MLNLKGGDLTEAKLASLGKVLVDFWAPWCGPCRMVAPILEQVAAETAGKATIAKVNIDDNPDAAAAFGVASIPTMILFVDGKEVSRMIGANPKGAILDFINGQN